jgi:hypothetical protein
MKLEVSMLRIPIVIFILNTLFQISTCKEPTLIIKEESNGEVVGCIAAECQVICKTEGLLRGILTCFATCYVFNTNYCKNLKNTMTFIQTGLLGINNSGKAQLVTKLMKQINVNMQEQK